MKQYAALLLLFSWVFGYTVPIRFPLIALDVATLLLLVTHWKTVVRVANGHRIRSLGSLGFLGVLLFSWVFSLRMFSVNEALPGLLYLLRTSMYVVILIFAKELFKSVSHWIPIALWMFIGLGICQYLFLPDTRFLLYSGWDEHYYRLIGTALDPNYAGAMVGVVGIWGMFEFSRTRTKSMLFLSLASFASLVLTFSRASWIATLVGFLVLLVRQGSFQAQKVRPYKVRPFPVKWACVLIGVFVVFAVYAMAPRPGGEGVRLTRTVSVFERLVSWQNAIKMWQYYPLIGVGFNNYKIAALQYGFLTDPLSHAANAPSSSWLLILSTLGVIGMLGVFGMLRRAAIRLWQDPLWSAIAVLVGVHAVFNNTVFYVPMLALLAILKGTSNHV